MDVVYWTDLQSAYRDGGTGGRAEGLVLFRNVSLL